MRRSGIAAAKNGLMLCDLSGKGTENGRNKTETGKGKAGGCTFL